MPKNTLAFRPRQRRALKGHGFWSDPSDATRPFCSALLWHVRCSFLYLLTHIWKWGAT